MNIGVLSKKHIMLPQISKREVLRYAGVKGGGDDTLPLICECEKELAPLLKSMVVYRIAEISIMGDICTLGDARVKSKALASVLANAKYALIMAATLGMGADRLIYKYSHTNIAKAHLIDSVATERIEALCNAFCEELDKELLPEGLECGFRFSPGYSDLPLEFQREIFSLLEPEKYIGLTLNESLMMSPSKSVSAIVVLKANKKGCEKL